MPDYNEIFTTHVNRILAERNITKIALAEIAGVSSSFMTSFSRGEANPTIKTMQAISDGLGIPLPLLLRPLESEEWQTILSITMKEENSNIPDGYESVAVVLPSHKAFVAKHWAVAAKKKIRRIAVTNQTKHSE